MKLIPKNWENLTEEEQEEWNNHAEKYQGQLQILKAIQNMKNNKKCIFCKKEIEVVYARQDLKDKLVELGWLGFFTSDFLFHIKATHGYDPEVFLHFIKTTIDKINNGIN